MPSWDQKAWLIFVNFLLVLAHTFTLWNVSEIVYHFEHNGEEDKTEGV